MAWVTYTNKEQGLNFPQQMEYRIISYTNLNMPWEEIWLIFWAYFAQIWLRQFLMSTKFLANLVWVHEEVTIVLIAFPSYFSKPLMSASNMLYHDFSRFLSVQFPLPFVLKSNNKPVHCKSISTLGRNTLQSQCRKTNVGIYLVVRWCEVLSK